jgi:hypothetical protein
MQLGLHNFYSIVVAFCLKFLIWSLLLHDARNLRACFAELHVVPDKKPTPLQISQTRPVPAAPPRIC